MEGLVLLGRQKKESDLSEKQKFNKGFSRGIIILVGFKKKNRFVVATVTDEAQACKGVWKRREIKRGN